MQIRMQGQSILLVFMYLPNTGCPKQRLSLKTKEECMWVALNGLATAENEYIHSHYSVSQWLLSLM